MINDYKSKALMENVFLRLNSQFIAFSDSQQCKLDEEWPKINNEKVNFSQCVINQ